MGVASSVPRAGREIDVMSKFFEFRHDLRPINTIKNNSSASLSGAVFASTAVKMVRDGKRSPAPPEPAEGVAGPGQQRPKKRGRGRPRKGEGVTERSRSRSEGRRASLRIAEKETSTKSTGDTLSPRLKAIRIEDKQTCVHVYGTQQRFRWCFQCRTNNSQGCEVHANADQNAVSADDYRRQITTDSQARGGVSSTLTATTIANQAIQAPPPRILFSGPMVAHLPHHSGLNVAMATPASSFAVPNAATMGTLAPEMSLPNKSLFQSTRAGTCEGITSGSSGPVLSFVAKAQRSSSVMLDEMSWDKASGYGETSFPSSAFATSECVLAPFNGAVVRRLPGVQGFAIHAQGCTGLSRAATDHCSSPPGRELAWISSQANHARPLMRYDVPGPVLEERRKRIKAEMLARIESNGRVIFGEDADNLVEASNLIDKEVETKLEGDDLSEDQVEFRESWHVFRDHINNCHERGGNMRGIKYDTMILNWAVVFLARTSKRVYMEVAKVLKLPHISYIYRLSNRIVSRSSSRAYSLCTVTMNTMKMRSEKESWTSNQRLVVNAMDSASSATGLTWNNTKRTMMGQDSSDQFQPIHAKHSNLVSKQSNSNMHDVNSANIIENIPLAKEHLVCKTSCADPTLKYSEIVASTDVEKVTSSVMYSMTELVCQSLPNYGFKCIANVVDAHSSNWAALIAWSTHSAKDFLPKALMDEYKSIDFGIVHVYVDPVTGDPIVNMPDYFHLSKNVCFTLEKSSLKKHRRQLMYKKCPANLDMVETGWIATGGRTNALQPTRLSSFHFNKDANSRMDAGLTFDVLCGSVARLLQKAVDDPTITLGTFRNKKVYTPLINLIRKWDELSDIVNKWDSIYTPENGQERQRALLNILLWFQKWKDDHDERVKNKTRTEWNFFADETWKCIQMLIMSHVILIQWYCIERGMKLSPRRMNTDPVENHFGNCRSSVGGSTQSLTTAQWGAGDAKAGLAEAANFAAIGNSRRASEGEPVPLNMFSKRGTRY
ncbi:hypothetical protein THAOC_19553 [Thalassiosira oceanica]|uniref:Uncharacterized protein n=1 Tax=Thalassiosira oceanica TaxID=159749 RepID=K0S5J5_THAOC|nr:hypothetical protein THAOC_19553 [Thalassiosira oceanica]|eukprot:EJK60144.1 hypothetical protein THAOC_19553 [Thalassiosira oceanica]